MLFLLEFLTSSVTDGLGPFPTQTASGYSVYHDQKNTKAGLFKELGSHRNYPVGIQQFIGFFNLFFLGSILNGSPFSTTEVIEHWGLRL